MRAICRQIPRLSAWLCGVTAAACLAAAALSLGGADVEWPVAFGIALLAIFTDAGAIGWPTAMLAAVFFGALAFGFAGLHALAWTDGETSSRRRSPNRHVHFPR